MKGSGYFGSAALMPKGPAAVLARPEGAPQEGGTLHDHDAEQARRTR